MSILYIKQVKDFIHKMEISFQADKIKFTIYTTGFYFS